MAARSEAPARSGADEELSEPQPLDDDFVEQAILRKYELVQKLGHGAFSVVWKATSKKTRHTVAIKKLHETFLETFEARAAYREILYLSEFRGHDNIVRLKDVIESTSGRDLYLVLEYFETDLFNVLKAKVLEERHRPFVVYQLLRALLFVHSAQIVHRDVKPSNILLNADCHVKLADFGLARSVLDVDLPASHHNVGGSVMTDYLGTRWYRAPEALLGSTRYGIALDMWSVGCILGELISGEPTFPGTSTMNQVERVLEVTGRPSDADIDALHSPFAKAQLEHIPTFQPRALSQMFDVASAEALDFLRILLQFNPEKRVLADQALNHPYFAAFHNPDDEPMLDQPLDLELSDNITFSCGEYRAGVEKFIAISTKEKRKAHGIQQKLGYGFVD